MITLRDYQEEISTKGAAKLKAHGIIYLNMEVRTGKTLTALAIGSKGDYKRVLFITKKKAIYSIENDYKALSPDYKIEVVNFESIHKVEINPDLLIIDEAHKIGGYPKPSKAAKAIKEKYSHLPMILMSGTPSPESYSQLFHQFWVSQRSPFGNSTFYKWAKEYIDIKQRHFAHGIVNDYSNAKKHLILPMLDKYFLRYTQKKAGFKTEIKETILEVDMLGYTKPILAQLKKHQIVIGKNDTILADTPVKMLSKVHQISSGTCIGESGDVIKLDHSKAVFIHNHFKGKKLAIFYKFKGELDLLKDVFRDSLTEDVQEFENTYKHIALQIVSGREGISLKAADCLVYFNIDFSAVSYWQSRDRLTTKERMSNEVFWIFGKGGIEHDIYKTVIDKKDYTLNHFRRGERLSKENNQSIRERRVVCD